MVARIVSRKLGFFLFEIRDDHGCLGIEACNIKLAPGIFRIAECRN